MSHASHKGWRGQEEVKEFFEKVFYGFGWKFYNVGGAEKTRKVLAGDVCADPRSDCLLNEYFVEVKKQGHPNIWADAAKAKDDTERWGRRGYFLFVSKIPKGRGLRPEKLVAMEWETLGRLLTELQGYRKEYAQQPPKDK